MINVSKVVGDLLRKMKEAITGKLGDMVDLVTTILVLVYTLIGYKSHRA